MEITRNSAGESFIEYAPWTGVPGLSHGVTLRAPGRGPNEGLARLAGAARGWGFTGACRTAQVHGQRVLDIRLLGRGGNEAFDMKQSVEGDGLVGVEPGLLGIISVADCVPVFLLARERRAWALLHAGWRGITAGVLQEGLALLRILGKADPAETEIYLGPAICGRCYEVGREVAFWLGALETGAPGHVGRNERGLWQVDLRRILAHQACALGVAEDRIHTSSYCTRCHNNLFHSFRAEGESGLKRMWAFMGFSHSG